MSADELTLADLWQFARSLRQKPPQDASFDEFYSYLSEKTKTMRRPSEDQIRLARELGIRIDPQLHTAIYIGLLITAKSKAQGQAIITENKALRSGNVIMHEGVPYEITRIASVSGPWRVWLKCLMPGGRAIRSANLTQFSNARLATAEEVKAAKQAKKA